MNAVNRKVSLQHELFGAWCAPIFSLLTVVGFLGLARFYHPFSGGWTAAHQAQWYADHHLGVEWGMTLFAIASAFLAIYTVELTLVLWRREGSPLFAIGQLLGGFGVVMLIFISCCLWIGAAYRAGHTNPDVTVALNDTSWFGFLVGWIILALQMACTGVVIIRGRQENPLVPKWMGWYALIGSVALFTANGCVFAKSGIFSWNGALGFYLPMAIWGFYLDGFAFYVRRDVRTRQQALAAGNAPAEPQLVPEHSEPELVAS